MANIIKRLLPLRFKLFLRSLARELVGPASPDNQLNDMTANLLWQELERSRQHLHHKVDALERKSQAGDDLVLNSVNAGRVNFEAAMLSELRALNQRIDRLEAHWLEDAVGQRRSA